MRITFMLFNMLFIQKLEHMELRGKKIIRERNKNGTKEEKKRGNENFHNSTTNHMAATSFIYALYSGETHIFVIPVPPKNHHTKTRYED